MTPISKKISAYKALNKGFIKPIKFKRNDTAWAAKVFFAGVLPTLAAVALQGQAGCQGAQTTNYNLPYNSPTGAGFEIDVDGDGTNDFRIYDGFGQAMGLGGVATLKIRDLNGGKVITGGVGSGTAENFAFGATISGTDTNNYGANNGWYLVYVLANNPVGPWGPPYPSTGYIGVIQNGNYGFIQLTINSGPVPGNTGVIFNVTVSEAGVGNNTVSVIAGDCATLLPVELIDFSVKVNGAVQLNWATASETNNAGFEIERSLDGEKFNRIGFVEGLGSTNFENNYSYEDLTTQKGKTYYYRLKQVDYDGRFEYSKVISATLAADFEVGEAFPNPTNNGFVNLEFNSKTKDNWTASIYDVTGQEISNEKITIESGATIQEFDLTSLSQGVYFIKLENATERVYRKVVIQ